MNAVIGLGGVVVGVLIGHRLKGRSDREARNRDFIGFLEEWKSEISKYDLGPTTATVSIHPAIKAYDAKVGKFQKQIEIVRDVFVGSQKFDALTKRLGSLKQQDYQGDPRKVILDAIERLIEFCKNPA